MERLPGDGALMCVCVSMWAWVNVCMCDCVCVCALFNNEGDRSWNDCQDMV